MTTRSNLVTTSNNKSVEEEKFTYFWFSGMMVEWCNKSSCFCKVLVFLRAKAYFVLAICLSLQKSGSRSLTPKFMITASEIAFRIANVVSFPVGTLLFAVVRSQNSLLRIIVIHSSKQYKDQSSVIKAVAFGSETFFNVDQHLKIYSDSIMRRQIVLFSQLILYSWDL
ncbi:hypothetical protein BD560DRAFT_489119 [Blakeslea trispora]|nr:hypothetical protein BD560DRAFT_489119 [Blakeslea trispora]